MGSTDPAADPTADPAQVDPVDIAQQKANATPDETEPSASEKALIEEMTKKVEFPDYLKTWVNRFADYRDYISSDALLLDDEDTVSTNFMFRNMCVQIANLYANDPDLSFKPAQRIGPPDEMLGAFADTATLLIKQYLEDAKFKRRAWALMTGVYTCGIAWVKITPQEDYRRDPIGTVRQNDQQDNIAAFRQLSVRFAEKEFTEDSAEYQRYLDLQKTVTSYVMAQTQEDMLANPPATPVSDPLTGIAPPAPPDPRQDRLNKLQAGELDLAWVPEPSRFITFNIDQVMPEDIRWDWNITNPIDFYQSRWVAHRVYMAREEIGAKWGLQPDELKKLDTFDKKGAKITDPRKQEDPADRTDLEASGKNDRCAVWEFHDKVAGRVYVWACGITRFLDNYVPDVVWRNFFPFIPLGFNIVDGRFLPLSDVQLQMHLQDEINRLATHQAEARQACWPKFAIKKGSMTAEEKEALETAGPFQVVEVNSPTDVKDGLMAIGGGNYDPRLYDPTRAVHDMEVMSGISQAATGAVTKDDQHFATDTAVAAQQFGIQSDYRRTLLETFIGDVVLCIGDMAMMGIPEENVKARCGDMAFWPMVGRDQLFQQLRLDIKAGSTGRPDAKQETEFWTGMPQFLAGLGLMPNGLYIAEQAFKSMGRNIDINKVALGPMPPPVPGGGPPGIGAGKPGPGSGGPRPGSGAPPMSESGPPRPDQLPSHKGVSLPT